MKTSLFFSAKTDTLSWLTLHNFASGVAACQQAKELRPHPAFGFISAPGAAGFMGAGWWQALIRAVQEQSGYACPHILDCGADPGYALFAASQGQKLIVLEAPSPVLESVNEVYERLGGHVFSMRPPSFDLISTLSGV
ncbi:MULTISPECIES: hypothetical protein [Acetobacter]|uniref:hypothetical protein n=1 Tax=Acetobacter TaxID=434 RepID=UPI000A382822|nr:MULTISPECIES: hypothetical protein [Acetobacter]MBS0960841.1 hypothetical protein [Acetobacter thailandicus]MBS0981221.1 hypothetical protein [Acetobacter thailandicus]MBS1003127.1 hypothetical protein [Acetobacter thailandicus]